MASEQQVLQSIHLLHATEVHAKDLLIDQQCRWARGFQKTCGILHADSCQALPLATLLV